MGELDALPFMNVCHIAWTSSYAWGLNSVAYVCRGLLKAKKENGKLEPLPHLNDLALMGKGGKLEDLPLLVVHHKSLSVIYSIC
eukprot:125453-Ditylum_brightwellii.AAC.1